MQRRWVNLLILSLFLILNQACTTTESSPMPTGEIGYDELTVIPSITTKPPSPKPIFTNTPSPRPTTISTATPSMDGTLTPVGSESYTCSSFQWIEDVTIPDGTLLKPGQIFLKIWRIKNTGNCPWNVTFELAYDHGDRLDGPDRSRAYFYPQGVQLTSSLNDSSWGNFVADVKSGEVVDLPLFLRAPEKAGEYQGVWRLDDENGIGIDFLWVNIIVEEDADFNASSWSGEWIHSDPSSLFEEGTSLVLHQEGDHLKGYFYSLDGRIMLIEGRVSSDNRDVSGQWGAVDQGGSKFEWRLLNNNNQFQGIYHLGSFSSEGWCGARGDRDLPDPCEMEK